MIQPEQDALSASLLHSLIANRAMNQPKRNWLTAHPIARLLPVVYLPVVRISVSISSSALISVICAWCVQCTVRRPEQDIIGTREKVVLRSISARGTSPRWDGRIDSVLSLYNPLHLHFAQTLYCLHLAQQENRHVGIASESYSSDARHNGQCHVWKRHTHVRWWRRDSRATSR